MTHKEKVTISLDSDWLAEIGRVADARRTSRSALIEEALAVWHHKRQEAELAEGYQAMAKEDRKTAERNLRSGAETLGRGT